MSKGRIKIAIKLNSVSDFTLLRNSVNLLFGFSSIFDNLQSLEQDTNSGKFNGCILARFDILSQAQTIFNSLKTNQSIKNLGTGIISFHICPDEETEENRYNCKTDPRARYTEMVF